MVELREEPRIEVDVDDLHIQADLMDEGQRLIAEMAPSSCEELDHGLPVGPRSSDGVRRYLGVQMRPVTAIVVVVLLVLIAGAFLLKLGTSGFTP